MEANELDYISLGRRVKEARRKKGLKQGEVAILTGLTCSHMSHIETGKTKPALPTIVKIANVLEVSVDELLCDNLQHARPVYDQKIAELLADCDDAELKAFLEIIQSTKAVIRRTRTVKTVIL